MAEPLDTSALDSIDFAYDETDTNEAKRKKLWLPYVPKTVDNGNGTITQTVRTAFGEQFDHMNEFYNGLSPQQKALFVNPLAPNQPQSFEAEKRFAAENPQYVVDRIHTRERIENEMHAEDVKAFEATLNPQQLAQWKDLQATANKDANYIPEEASAKVEAQRIHNAQAVHKVLGYYSAGEAADAPREIIDTPKAASDAVNSYSGGQNLALLTVTNSGADLPDSLKPATVPGLEPAAPGPDFGGTAPKFGPK